MTAGERARALITAQVTKDEDAQRLALEGVNQVELAGVTGAILAYCGNLVQVVAIMWQVEPAEAWAALLAAERDNGGA